MQSGFHANFKLSAAGENLYLIDKDIKIEVSEMLETYFVTYELKDTEGPQDEPEIFKILEAASLRAFDLLANYINVRF